MKTGNATFTFMKCKLLFIYFGFSTLYSFSQSINKIGIDANDISHLSNNFQTKSNKELASSLSYLEDSAHFFNWDSAIVNWEQFPRGKRIIFGYDTSYHKLIESYLGWDDSTYANQRMMSYSYDSLGRLVTTNSFLANGNTWDNDERIDFTYDSAGNKLDQITQQWIQNAWVNKVKTSNVYNSNNLLTETVFNHWDIAFWRPASRDTFTDTTFNKLSSHVKQENFLGSWANSSKRIYNYTGSQVLQNWVLQEWNGLAWDNILRHVFTYDLNGNTTIDLTQIFYSFTNWANYYRETYTYNISNQMLTMLFQLWQNSQWQFFVKQKTTYYPSGQMESFNRKSGNGASNAIMEGDSTVYFYRIVNTIFEEAATNVDFKLYPNPARENVFIQLNGLYQDLSFEIIDANGILRYKLNLPHIGALPINVNLQFLSNGHYFCSLKSRGKIMSTKQLVLIKN